MKKPVCFRMEISQLDKLKDIAISLKMTNGELLRLITGIFIDQETNTRSMPLGSHNIGTQKLHAETYYKGVV
jgi:hypothetical protein